MNPVKGRVLILPRTGVPFVNMEFFITFMRATLVVLGLPEGSLKPVMLSIQRSKFGVIQPSKGGCHPIFWLESCSMLGRLPTPCWVIPQTFVQSAPLGL